MKVSLTKEEMTYVAELGRLRTEENKYSNDIPDYDKKRFRLTSLQANRLGVMTEFGVGKALGFQMMEVDNSIWAGFVPSRDYARFLGQPDINGILEVRRAEKKENPLPLRTKDVRAAALVVQGHVHYSYVDGAGAIRPNAEVELLGWADAVADWDTGIEPVWCKNGDSRVVTKRPMSTLPLSRVMAGGS